MGLKGTKIAHPNISVCNGCAWYGQISYASLFLCSLAVAAHELVYAAGRVNELVLAGIERV